MKKAIIFIVFLIGLVLVGCGEKAPDLKLVVDKTELNMKISTTGQDKQKLNVTVENLKEGEEVKILFNSKDTSIATVDDDGTVTAKAVGETEITVTVEGYSNLKATVKVVVEVDENNQFTLVNIPNLVVAGENVQLQVTDILDEGAGLLWVALTPEIATISDSGVVNGKSAGKARFEVHSKTNGNKVSFQIDVVLPEVEEVKIIPNITSDKIKTTDNLVLQAEVLPKYAYQEVYWVSDDDSIADIDELGNVTIYTYGVVTFKAISAENNQIVDELTVEFYWDVMDIIDYIMVDEVLVKKNIKAIGYQDPGYWLANVLGSVSNYYFGTYKEVERIIPKGLSNRPEIKQPSTEYVTVHDTASIARSADASAHANYVNSGGGGTSWHYSIGNDGVYKQLPLDEISYHAGDGSRTYGLLDTGIKVTSKRKPAVAIDSAGYYTLNNERTLIQAPRGSNNEILTTAHINDYGVTLEIGENGNWWMGKTHYDSTYKRIGNDGGNRNSIGIETMVNEGSDLYLTWQYTAKKVAELLLMFNLGVDRLKFHHFFSGKNCPQTMRDNGLIDNFLKLVEAEYLVQKFLSDYNISLVSSNPELVDNNGKLLKLPTQATQVTVIVSITNDSGFNQTRAYRYTIQP